MNECCRCGKIHRSNEAAWKCLDRYMKPKNVRERKLEELCEKIVYAVYATGANLSDAQGLKDYLWDGPARELKTLLTERG
jgi:hypothetical protein